MKYISIIFIFFILFSCKENPDAKKSPDSDSPNPEQTENQNSDTTQDSTPAQTTQQTEVLTTTPPQESPTPVVQAEQETPDKPLSDKTKNKILEMLSGAYIGEVDVDYSLFSNFFVKNESVSIRVVYSNINNDRKIIIFIQSDTTEESLCSIISDLQFNKVAQTISGKIQSRGQIKDARTVSGNIKLHNASFLPVIFITLLFPPEYEIRNLYIGESAKDMEQVTNLQKVKLPDPISFKNVLTRCESIEGDWEFFIH